MKTVIKTTIGIIAIAMGSVSVAQAEHNRHERGYEKPRQQMHFRENQRRHEWKHAYKQQQRYREDRHYRKHHSDRHARVIERRHWKRPHKYVDKHIYRGHERRRVEKHHYRKHGYHHRTYAPSHRMHEKVIVRGRHHGHSALPVLAGGLIGSAIGHDIGDGDPAAIFGGAIFGAMLGDAVSRH